jgi:beta-mannosidase
VRRRTVSLLLAITLILAAAMGAVPSASADGLQRFDLDGRWQVVREGTTEVIPATVPGCIHTDLLAAKKIPDPFFRDNERAVQWIGEANWVYRRSFDVPAELV